MPKTASTPQLHMVSVSTSLTVRTTGDGGGSST